MRKGLAILAACGILGAGSAAAYQDADPQAAGAPQDAPPSAQSLPPEPDSPKAEVFEELSERVSAGDKPANLVALLRSVNRFVWKHTDAGKPYPRDRYFPLHPLLVDEHSPALAQAQPLAAEGFFARLVKVRLPLDEVHSREGRLVLRGRIQWRQRELHEYFDSEDRARLAKLKRAIAVLKEDLRELQKGTGKTARGRSRSAGDEVDEEIRKLLRELIRQALGEVPGEDEPEPEKLAALRELQLAEAQKEVAAIYTAARQRKQYSETTYVIAYVIPQPNQELSVARLARTKRLQLQGVISDGLLGRPFLLSDKPFMRRIVMAASVVDRK